MMDFKVEWVFDDRLISEADGFTAKEMAEAGRIPVVRLAEVETLIAKAEQFAKVIVEQYEKNPSRLHYIPLDTQHESAQAFLASIAAWRKGQEGKS